jgi:hypothetical protein
MDLGGRSAWDKVGPNDSGLNHEPGRGQDEGLKKSSNSVKSRGV